MGFDIVAFDLDGTLADTAADLAAALNHALESLGRPRLPLEVVRLMVGHGTRALLQKGLAATGASDEAMMKRGLPILLEHYEANICRSTTAYPYANETLDALNDRGIRTAICTNKPEHLARLLIDGLGWGGKFAAIIGGDTLTVAKPDPAMLHEAIARCGGGRALYVGDSITDADTAKAASVPFVAVSFGFCDRPVEQLGADAIIDSFQALAGVMEMLSERP